MDRLDDAITQQFAERVCSTERLLILMAELRKGMQGTKNDEQKRVQALNAQLKKIEQRQHNLLAAIENGLPFDEVLQKRSQELKSERESLLIELSSVRRSLAVPMERILPSNVEAFSKADGPSSRIGTSPSAICKRWSMRSYWMERLPR